MTSAVESITVAVRDLDAAVRLFGGLGLRTESDTRASVSLLGAWRYPVHADVRLVELSFEGYAFGRLRLAHFLPAGPTRIAAGNADERYAQVGPQTLEMYAAAPTERVGKVLRAAGYSHDGSPDGVYRNGENLALKLLSAAEGARTSLASGSISEIVRISLLSADPALAEQFYRDALGLVAAETVPPSFRDRQQPSGAIQVRRLAENAVLTPIHPPMPGQQLGINLLSLRSSDLDVLETRLRTHNVEIVTRPTHAALGDGVPARLMLVRGPDRELLELIERET